MKTMSIQSASSGTSMEGPKRMLLSGFNERVNHVQGHVGTQFEWDS